MRYPPLVHSAKRGRKKKPGALRFPVTSPPADVTRIEPDTTPLIDQRGWKKNRNTWSGPYATKYGTWHGRIERRGDVFDVLINKPPPEVQEHSKRFQCFSKQERGWWKIHLHTNPVDGDPSAIIDYVERLLHRSIESGRANN